MVELERLNSWHCDLRYENYYEVKDETEKRNGGAKVKKLHTWPRTQPTKFSLLPHFFACCCAHEGDPMYHDVICILLSWTPFSVKEAYCSFMKAGSILLLSTMVKYQFSLALFSSIHHSQFYAQAVQRMVCMGASLILLEMDEGRELCRRILPHFLGSDILSVNASRF